MKRILEKFNGLTISKKIQLITAMVLTVVFLIAIPVYAWFTNHRKAAEMFKVAHPNALYINAAHREDQVNFALDGININDYQIDDNGNIVTNEHDEPVKIKEKRYVFSVSGSDTNKFILQMAHTNNNLFTYKIYEATETTTKPSSGTTYVEYKATGKHNENSMVFAGDSISEGDMLYYVKGSLIKGEYKNVAAGSSVAKNKDANDIYDTYYNKTYGDNTNVEEHAVPSYWQATINSAEANKQFCKHFILEVTWVRAVQDTQTAKETDLVYLSVERTN